MGSSIQSDQMAYEPIWVTGNHGNAAPDTAPLPCGLDSKSKARGGGGSLIKPPASVWAPGQYLSPQNELNEATNNQ
ncbi:unnamed protein product [Trichobilharzia regenti]|nr:unnamed protein product [Trichobilharzia regenti]